MVALELLKRIQIWRRLYADAILKTLTNEPWNVTKHLIGWINGIIDMHGMQDQS